MADRRPSFRFWPSNSRRPPPNRAERRPSLPSDQSRNVRELNGGRTSTSTANTTAAASRPLETENEKGGEPPSDPSPPPASGQFEPAVSPAADDTSIKPADQLGISTPSPVITQSPTVSSPSDEAIQPQNPPWTESGQTIDDKSHEREITEKPDSGQDQIMNPDAEIAENSSTKPNEESKDVKEVAQMEEEAEEKPEQMEPEMNSSSPEKTNSDITTRGLNVITLAGDNRGASMEMGRTFKGDKPIHIHRAYKNKTPEENTVEENTAAKAKDQPVGTYVNNNAQGINNSIVLNGSISGGNPGVYMVVTHIPKDSIHSRQNKNISSGRKVNGVDMGKLTFKPTIRRRCLRGLFLEPSESDPEQPVRHGCRACDQRYERTI